MAFFLLPPPLLFLLVVVVFHLRLLLENSWERAQNKGRGRREGYPQLSFLFHYTYSSFFLLLLLLIVVVLHLLLLDNSGKGAAVGRNRRVSAAGRITFLLARLKPWTSLPAVPGGFIDTFRPGARGSC